MNERTCASLEFYHVADAFLCQNRVTRLPRLIEGTHFIVPLSEKFVSDECSHNKQTAAEEFGHSDKKESEISTTENLFIIINKNQCNPQPPGEEEVISAALKHLSDIHKGSI